MTKKSLYTSIIIITIIIINFNELIRKSLSICGTYSIHKYAVSKKKMISKNSKLITLYHVIQVNLKEDNSKISSYRKIYIQLYF